MHFRRLQMFTLMTKCLYFSTRLQIQSHCRHWTRSLSEQSAAKWLKMTLMVPWWYAERNTPKSERRQRRAEGEKCHHLICLIFKGKKKRKKKKTAVGCFTSNLQKQNPPGTVFFFVWKIPVKWLLIYAKSNQRLIHNAWARRYQFCNAFGLLDVIANAADEILALLPVLLWLHGSGWEPGQPRWKCKEDNRKPEPQHPLPSERR